MSTPITTQQGDTVDLLCQRHLGQTQGLTEDTLRRNRGLAAHGPILQAGLVIQLPDKPALAPKSHIQLWD